MKCNEVCVGIFYRCQELGKACCEARSGIGVRPAIVRFSIVLSKPEVSFC
jgi:hypothetical protein